LARLIARTEWSIELPEQWSGFFKESGLSASTVGDARRGGRVRVRTHGVAVPEKTVPAIPRPFKALGIFTSDFSRHGFGFMADRQFFPTEVVRIILPTFWMRVNVVRCRRLGTLCFENGAELVQRLDPSDRAFEGLLDELGK